MWAWPCCIRYGAAMRPANCGEHLPEHALAAVAVDDALVVDEVGRGFRERALRHPGRDGLLFQLGEEAIERHAVVAGRAARAGRRRRSGRSAADVRLSRCRRRPAALLPNKAAPKTIRSKNEFIVTD